MICSVCFVGRIGFPFCLFLRRGSGRPQGAATGGAWSRARRRAEECCAWRRQAWPQPSQRQLARRTAASVGPSARGGGARRSAAGGASQGREQFVRSTSAQASREARAARGTCCRRTQPAASTAHKAGREQSSQERQRSSRPDRAGRCPHTCAR